jgi:hypothetical protein
MPAKNLEPGCAPVDYSPSTDTANSPSNNVPGAVGRLPLILLKRAGRFGWYSLKKTTYIAFLIIAVMALFLALDRLAEFALKQTHLAYVYPKDFAMVKRDVTRPVSHYDYDFTPGTCILHNQAKGSRGSQSVL